MMRLIFTLSILFIISISSFGQSIKYSVNGGMNYCFFSMSSCEAEKDEPSGSTGYNSQISTFEKEIESKGKIGFYVTNDFTFPINNFLAFKTGFGLSMNNVDLKTTYTYSFSGYPNNLDSLYALIPDSVFLDYSYQSNSSKSNYNIFALNIPMQLQFSLVKQRLLLSAGFSMSAIIQVKNTNDLGTENSYTYYANDEFENVFFNLSLGADYRIFKNLYAGIHYDRSISNIETNTYPSYYPNETQYKLHMNSLSLNVTWLFTKKAK